MKITMIGTGYVGLVTGTCFAESGNDVTCLDIDQRKVDLLNSGGVPIYEPGLEELVKRNAAAGRLTFTTSYENAISSAECIFICVGTPQDESGAADLKYVQSAAEHMAPFLRKSAVVVCKSTVPVGTNRRVAGWIKAKTNTPFRIASNPEFLKEGAAIDDFTKPDRVVVGVDDPGAAEVLMELYKPFLRTEKPFLSVCIESAEMIKYAANCMLATKISFINEMANICECVGADINEVRKGIGHDSRIGFSFLFPGVGYGGSCFPKDVRALAALASEHGVAAGILRTVDETNNLQKHVLFRKLSDYFEGDLSGRTIAVWGLSFKPRTDDIREAPSLVLIKSLLDAGANVKIHDPVALNNVKKELGDRVIYCDHHYDACDGADAIAIVTEWNEFRNPDFDYIKLKMKAPVIFDGRNLYDRTKMAARGFYYSGIGLSALPVHD
ncbi:MAG TPA: UDP-glucose/GDP-mannose dehydrogenase family protein [Planctomycetaceae bacterium]|nr:UDP-glucose/GDP-mannose dehydrogenase family protein [Planctomycetaceae bacterium]HQZ64926.1 UDP-glucose/GDP-mannose dehydrogenase family protein [Planctomycetaceae bacterium]HRA86737.1 UDP-glucose/GDP-mannose dehydrogenase family protein [Planctomycetaceae bacterium]